MSVPHRHRPHADAAGRRDGADAAGRRDGADAAGNRDEGPAVDSAQTGEPGGVQSLAFRTELSLGLADGAVIERRPGFRVIRTRSNPTFYWGNFLLLDEPPAPGAVDGWMRAFRAEFPGAGYLALGVDGTDGAAGEEAELAAAGVSVERSTVLTAVELAEPRHAGGDAELRMLDLGSDADWEAALALKVDNNEGVPDDAYVPYARRALELRRAQQAAGRGGWFGAFADGRMVSGLGVFVAGTSVSGDGVARYQTVDTHRDYRNRGLAGSLVHMAGLYALRELGVSRLVIVADPEYHAIALYRSLGFAGTETQVQLAHY